MSLDYYFECPEIQTITVDGKAYDRVVMPNAPSGGDVGKPALPAAGARVLLPYGSEVAGVDIVPSERVLVGSGFDIQPVAQPVLLSADQSAKSPPIMDEAIYNSGSPFPSKRFEQTGIYGFRGYQILILRLQPTEYIPSTGELYY
ncbi:MAG: hypothetical protein JSU69_09220, partial [Candidatus Zixiibacteriota bacterium]